MHKTQVATLYCVTCKQMGCNTSAVTRHKTHDCLKLEDADIGFVTKTQEAMESLRKLASNGDSDIHELSKARSAVRIDSVNTMNSIDVFTTEARSDL